MQNQNSKNKLTIVHLMNSGPRSPTIINQGLIELGVNLHTDNNYISLGKIIHTAEDNIILHLHKANYIFASDDDNLIVSKKYDKILSDNNWWKKTIWYDFRDSCEINFNILQKALIYFKRSIVYPDRTYITAKYKKNQIYPIDYAALKEYYLDDKFKRNIRIGCFFSGNNLGSRRQQLVNCLRKVPECYIGNTCLNGKIARRSIELPPKNCFDEYIKLLNQTQIIFTAFPQNHDGDSRTWEAFASGAVVFRDKTYIPQENPLLNNVHYYEYDASSIKSIHEAINKARNLTNYEIAESGYNFVKSHHLPIHRVNYMLKLARNQQIRRYSI